MSNHNADDERAAETSCAEMVDHYLMAFEDLPSIVVQSYFKNGFVLGCAHVRAEQNERVKQLIYQKWTQAEQITALTELVKRQREALKFYAGEERKWAVWENSNLLTFDEYGGLCEKISGPKIAFDALSIPIPDSILDLLGHGANKP